MDFSQQFVSHQMAAADLFLGMVNMTPSLLLLMFSWDNEIPTSSVFTFWQAKISPLWQYLANRAAGGLSLCLRLYLKSWTEGAMQTAKSYLYRNPSRDDSLGLFSLKIGRDLARALLMFDVDSFAARLSKQRRQQQSLCRWSFLSFLLFFFFNSFNEGN